MPDPTDPSPAAAAGAEPYGPPCPGCGETRTAAAAEGLAWSSRHTARGVEYSCPACTRAEIAQIEAGLPVARHSSAA